MRVQACCRQHQWAYGGHLGSGQFGGKGVFFRIWAWLQRSGR